VSLYELLLTLHLLAIATWFGSGLAITVMGFRALKAGTGPFSSLVVNASAWASRAHPAAGVLLLLTGIGMVADAGYSFGELWIVIALAGIFAAMGVGGGLIGRTSAELVQSIGANGGTLAETERPAAERLLLYSRIETAILVIVIIDMVAKPGL
jgi:Predicted integral membrane protein (DUF2269)